MVCAAAGQTRTESGSNEVKPPASNDSLLFAVIGDTGTGGREAYEIAAQLEAARAVFPFKFAVMMGDNLYGGEKPRDYERKFTEPYQALIDAGVKFYAVLGNHDEPTETSFKLFNMGGKRYYTFSPRNGVRFFALDSNYMSREQLEWLEKELSGSRSDWKIVFFHHPLYSSGEKHGPSLELRKMLEPLFVKYGVSVVLAGHEHFYERIKPQNGIYYFIEGSSAKLREGGIERTEITAKGYAEDRTFMLMEIAGDELRYQTINRRGRLVDSGSLTRSGAK
jgi:predicted phosphodiesterase